VNIDSFSHSDASFKGKDRRLKKTDCKLHNLYSSTTVNGDEVKEDAIGRACSILGFENVHVASMSE
jgi:hypothetical protein